MRTVEFNQAMSGREGAHNCRPFPPRPPTLLILCHCDVLLHINTKGDTSNKLTMGTFLISVDKTGRIQLTSTPSGRTIRPTRLSEEQFPTDSEAQHPLRQSDTHPVLKT